jgi:ribosomal protein RSM22 (predicted rRNA methylase)
MELPTNLHTALDHTFEHVKPADLARWARELSARYRESDASTPFLRSDMDVLAYSAYRLPATYAAVAAALTYIKDVMPDWQPRSVLDVGAGPGTASWAASESWPSIADVELVERDERMIAFGESLTEQAEFTPLWHKIDMIDVDPDQPRDLVVVSYALNEIDVNRRGDLLRRLWAGTSSVLLLVETGTPAGFEIIRAARALLVELGARVAAPCPHSSVCPMANGDWCHFSRRLARSRVHRDAKDVTIGFEDEKYSYVALTRRPFAPVRSRVLRHPQIRPGHIHLELCTPDGLQRRVVSKRDKEQFREARHTRWGSAIGPLDKAADPNGATAERSQIGP